MSDLPTQKSVVPDAPSSSYNTSHNHPTHQRSPQTHASSPFADPFQPHDLRPRNQRHAPAQTPLRYQRDDEGAFRAPGAHAILNPPNQPSQLSSHVLSPPLNRSDVARLHPTNVSAGASSSLPQHSRNFGAASSRYSHPAAVSTSAQQHMVASAPELALSSEFLRYTQPQLGSQRAVETADESRERRTGPEAGSPPKKRRLAQSADLSVHDSITNNQMNANRRFSSSSLQLSGVGPSRPGDTGAMPESSHSYQEDKFRAASDTTRQRSASSPEQPTSPQFLTLQTDQGPLYLPVDTQAASRMADEKRKRNAGASARFRARRKEREHASSREIEGLRTIIRDLDEEVKFYRKERDYFAGILMQDHERARHFPRPPSPRRYRNTNQTEHRAGFKPNLAPKDASSPTHQEFGLTEHAELSPTEPYSAVTRYKSQLAGGASSQPTAYADHLEGTSPARGVGHQGQLRFQSSPDLPQSGEQYQPPATQNLSGPSHPSHPQSPFGR